LLAGGHDGGGESVEEAPRIHGELRQVDSSLLVGEQHEDEQTRPVSVGTVKKSIDSSGRCVTEDAQVDCPTAFSTLDVMEVILSADLQAKLTRAARQRGVDAQALALEAIERFIDYDDWFEREVEEGLAQIERGETLRHEEVGARLEKYLIEKQHRP
jgi:predicted transcriptional regulator